MVVDRLKVRDDLGKLPQVVKRDFSAIISDLFLARSTVIQETKKHPLYAVTNIPHVGGIKLVPERFGLLDGLRDRRRIQAEAGSDPNSTKSRSVYTGPACHEVEQLPCRFCFGSTEQVIHAGNYIGNACSIKRPRDRLTICAH